MPAEVETMMSVRETPWHGLGTIVPANLTATEALVVAGLDWSVHKAPIFASYDVVPTEITTHMATVRNTDGKVLGVVGRDYEPIQNERWMSWLQDLVDTGEAQFTTAGSLAEGRICFACLEVNVKISLPGGDEIVPYLVGATGHDGSHSLKAFTTPTRTVCKNTLDIGERNARSSFNIRHTLNADWRIESARQMLGLVVAYYDEFADRARDMIEQHVYDAQFEQMVKHLMPMPEDETPRQRESVRLRRQAVKTMYHGDTIGEYRSTAWGAVNAVNEYELWAKGVKGSRLERQAMRTLNRDFPLTYKAMAYLGQ